MASLTITPAGPLKGTIAVPGDKSITHRAIILSALAEGDSAIFAYKCTTPYDPKSEQAVRWDDPDLGIDWPTRMPMLSHKDVTAPRLGMFVWKSGRSI